MNQFYVRPWHRVLTGHDIAAQIDGDGILSVHPAFLAKGFDWAASLEGGVEFVKERTKTKAFGSSTSASKIDLVRLFNCAGSKRPVPNGGRRVINISPHLPGR